MNSAPHLPHARLAPLLTVAFLHAEALLLPAIERSFGPCEAFPHDVDGRPVLSFFETTTIDPDNPIRNEPDLIATLEHRAGRWCVVAHIECRDQDLEDCCIGSPLLAYAPTVLGAARMAADQLSQWADG